MEIEIFWADRKLEKACAQDKAGRRRFGADGWTILKRRLATLAAAPTLKDMEGTPGRFHQLGADRPGEFSLDLLGPHRLVIEPAHNPMPIDSSGGIDRARVTQVRIKEVTDYHGR